MPMNYCPECGTRKDMKRETAFDFMEIPTKPRRKRKLSAWNKYVKANSKKP